MVAGHGGGSMTFSITRLTRDDGTSLALYTWPAPSGPVKAVVQIAHGMSEHAARYDRSATALIRAGYAVYASDHRGHGKTAERPEDYGYFADHHGFQRVVDDLYLVNRHIAAQMPSVPRVLFGHSFGSFVTQNYLFTRGDTINAAVLSGTSSGVAKSAKLQLLGAYFERWRIGSRNRSDVIQRFTFGEYNARFTPARTEFDWLSRDPAEVDKYIADPLCGFAISTQAWVDVIGGLIHIEDAKLQARVPKSLPIYIFGGEEDPVGHAGRGPRILAAGYERAGVSDVTLKLYPDGRHEMVNEINRDQVVTDLIAWLDAHLTLPTARTSSAQTV
jgi:alpha-beta hydrolase superfamily lysophospholipase